MEVMSVILCLQLQSSTGLVDLGISDIKFCMDFPKEESGIMNSREVVLAYRIKSVIKCDGDPLCYIRLLFLQSANVRSSISIHRCLDLHKTLASGSC
jgi:hypothetical protein